MLLGRTHERLALERVFAQAQQGRSGVLALVGEPGIGKTALLDHAAASARGLRVVRARGVESEAVIPFAALAELLRPLLAALDRIPSAQAAALSGALALTPSASARDRFAIGAATLSLLSASAEEGPLAVLVDDAHWLDRSSAEALLFATRRLVADPIAVVLAAREGKPSLLDGAGLRTLRLGGLDRADAAALLERRGVRTGAADGLFSATGGNPLALLELAPQAERLAQLPGATPVPISSSIAGAFLERFGTLPAATRRALALVAAAGPGDLAALSRAARLFGVELVDLEPAEAAGLVTIGDAGIEFTHPLARAAIYAEASPSERRAAHRALADALPDRDVDRRAWHLAAASVGPDAHASRALAQAGERARERSAYAVAATAFERAAALATDEHVRDELTLVAASSAWLAGDVPRTLAALELGETYAPDAIACARIAQLRGEVALRCGPVSQGYRLIVGAAPAISAADPEAAVAMLAEAVLGCFYAGDTPAMLAAAERAGELAAPLDSARSRFFAAIANGIALVAVGRGEAGAASTRTAIAVMEGSDSLGEDPTLLAWAALGPLWLREVTVGRDLIERAFDRAREQVALGTLPRLLHLLARDLATTDQWPAAEASYDEAIGLAREMGQRVELAAALAGMAWLQARQGREEACRSHAAEAAALCEELGVGLFAVWTLQALGDLELGLGRPRDAIAHYDAQAAALRALGIADVDLSPAPELVEALQRVGRGADAAPVAAEFIAEAQGKGQPWALARALRCRGLLAGEEAVERWFEEALVAHERTPDAFEAARTRLAYGARLRRMRKRVRAREQLSTAAEAFERLGAQLWLQQADAELAATGERARRRDASTLDDLTPQELRIARLLADGMTTREAAAAIFVSPKTVEYHLSHVYTKLGIHSREELVAALGTPPGEV
jgi:DNA-binding CsgD family transcriptional regulator